MPNNDNEQNKSYDKSKEGPKNKSYYRNFKEIINLFYNTEVEDGTDNSIVISDIILVPKLVYDKYSRGTKN